MGAKGVAFQRRKCKSDGWLRWIHLRVGAARRDLRPPMPIGLSTPGNVHEPFPAIIIDCT
jgi:hypothetical protein